MSAPWCDQLSKGLDKILRQKFPLKECLCVENVSITPTESFVLLSSGYLLILK